jgi:predicted CXXCH cytochrome family protein
MKRNRTSPFAFPAHPLFRYGLFLLPLLVVLVGFLIWRSRSPAAVTPNGTTISGQSVAYAPEQRCLGCHMAQAALWQNSHHELAMQEATSATVLGDFNDVTFTAFGVTTRFYQKDGAYWINTQGADGAYADFAVKYTFGVDPLQQYLVAMPNGRFQAFTVAWDVVQKRWFHLYPDAEIPPNDPLHWTRRHFTWNSSCAECHSTDLQSNYNLTAGQYATQWAAINVGCQACHGPGEQHVQWAEHGDKAVETTKGLIVDYPGMTTEQLTENCAPCHARRHPISPNDRTGEPFLDHFMPELLTEGRYYADGQILDEVFIYGSFVQSKMAQQGVRCTDCHEPHGLTLRAEGNALCVQCHQPTPPTARFAGLQAKSYDTAEHHFHRPGSAGAQCVNCHMPARTYMVIDPRRDHSFRIPRPDLSITLNTPNACTQCHTDQTAAWAVEIMTAWYGTAWQRPHYGTVLAAGRRGDPDAVEPLRNLIGDTTQPAIVRATALDLLNAYGDLGQATRLTALSDKAALVRAVAAQGTVATPATYRTALLALLRDPIRTVRIEAANALAGLPTPTLTAAEATRLHAALSDYEIAQQTLADHPEGHFNLGGLHERRGRPADAVTAYQRAIEKDPFFFPAYLNLGNLHYRQGALAQAEQVFGQGLEQMPAQGDLHYALGLLLAEQRQLDEALTHLAQAAQSLVDRPRVHYNYGLLLQQMGRPVEAEQALRQAIGLAPADPEILYAIVSLYANQGRHAEARPYGRSLVQLYPAVPEFQQLFKLLQNK